MVLTLLKTKCISEHPMALQFFVPNKERKLASCELLRYLWENVSRLSHVMGENDFQIQLESHIILKLKGFLGVVLCFNIGMDFVVYIEVRRAPL